MAERKLVTLENLTTFAGEIKAKYAKQADFTTLQAEVKALEAASGEHNKIEIVKVNGSALPITPSDRSVDIEVPEDTADLTNGAGFQNKSEVETAINAKLASTYKAAGSVTPTEKFAAAPSADEVGKVYNANAPFDTNEFFVDTPAHNYPAGTNVVAVDEGDESYKWDVLAGFVDLTEYAKSAKVSEDISAAITDLNISDYAKTTDMESYVGTQLEDYYDKTTMDGKLEGYVQSSALGDYVTNTSLTSTLTAYVKNTDISEIDEATIKALLADGE